MGRHDRCGKTVWSDVQNGVGVDSLLSGLPCYNMSHVEYVDNWVCYYNKEQVNKYAIKIKIIANVNAKIFTTAA